MCKCLDLIMLKNNKIRVLYILFLYKIGIYSYVYYIKVKIEVDYSSLCIKKYCVWILCIGFEKK